MRNNISLKFISTKKVLLYCITLVFLVSCSQAPGELKLFTLLPSGKTNITFSNTLEENGAFNIIEYMYYYDGGGVAAGDINNDGLPDLFFTANLLSDRLYLNKGDFVFEDISEQAGIGNQIGWSTGVAMADVNGDGYLDIYVSQLGDYKGVTGANQLYINNGDLTFTEKAADYGLSHIGFSTQASFFDYDNDGDLDMYLLNHAVHSRRSYGPSTLRLQKDRKAGDRLFRNESDNHEPVFVDVTDEAGIYSSHIGYGLSIAAGDINNDGCIDIFIANDFHENDYLYINNCDGTFTESIEQYFRHTSRSSMGNDMADFNNDGRLDIMVLDMLPHNESTLKRSAGEDPMDIFTKKLDFGYYHQLVRNTLQVNQGNGLFSDIALLAGIYATDWSWSPLFCDLDNDGYKDLFVSTGIVRRPNDLDYINYLNSLDPKAFSDPSETDLINKMLIDSMPSEKIPNFAFHYNGNLTFTDKAREWGLDQPAFSNGAVYADLDNDGDLDLITNNINQEAFVYRNNQDTLLHHNFLQVRLKGSGKNTFGIGAKVLLMINDQVLYQEQMPVRGFQSTVNNILHFGIGDHTAVDTLRIIWPDSKTQVITQVDANQSITLYQKDAVTSYHYPAENKKARIFAELSSEIDITFKHEENPNDGFMNQPLRPHLLTTQGPKIAVADINGDGLDDFFAGGARNQHAQLFIQTRMGTFHESLQSVFMADSVPEDIGAAFLDVDGDKDQDLYVVSGGDEWHGSYEPFRDRLYLNDGSGNFVKATGMLPENMIANGSCVRPADYDMDGDMDLFVGSRSVINSYGMKPGSFLLENDGSGKFQDVTARIVPQLAESGMVTDAVWTDIDNDQRPDLILVGEWMPVIILKNTDDGFIDITANAGLGKTNGWWNAVIAGDFDNDGDQDLIGGNLGLNTKIKASQEKPATMYVMDFDNNGIPDPILCFYKNGYSIPFATRDELIKQLPVMMRKFATYSDYANVTSVYDIFSEDQLKDARVLEAFNFHTSYIENLGNDSFRIKSLPVEAQFSPVFSLYSEDFDMDGIPDLVLGGNFNAISANFGMYDASYGLFLKGNGRGDFHPLEPGESGWIIKGEVRDIQKIKLADGRTLMLVARNNEKIKLFGLIAEKSGNNTSE